MDKKFGYYVFGGMLLGVILGWFAVAAAMEKEKENKETTK